MHSHVGSALHAVGFFISIAILGTLWRLIALHLMATSNRTAQKVGTVMLFQY